MVGRAALDREAEVRPLPRELGLIAGASPNGRDASRHSDVGSKPTRSMPSSDRGQVCRPVEAVAPVRIRLGA